MVIRRVLRAIGNLWQGAAPLPVDGVHSPQDTHRILLRERARADRSGSPVSVVTFRLAHPTVPLTLPSPPSDGEEGGVRGDGSPEPATQAEPVGRLGNPSCQRPASPASGLSCLAGVLIKILQGR